MAQRIATWCRNRFARKVNPTMKELQNKLAAGTIHDGRFKTNLIFTT